MALFFDSAWFDARLAALGVQRNAVGSVLGLTTEQLAELWKDQRELTADDVRLLAALLNVSAKDVADRAGVSTPVPKSATDDDAVLALDQRLSRVESLLFELRGLVLELRERWK